MKKGPGPGDGGCDRPWKEVGALVKYMEGGPGRGGGRGEGGKLVLRGQGKGWFGMQKCQLQKENFLSSSLLHQLEVSYHGNGGMEMSSPSPEVCNSGTKAEEARAPGAADFCEISGGKQPNLIITLNKVYSGEGPT